jgi:hypothetical protein
MFHVYLKDREGSRKLFSSIWFRILPQSILGKRMAIVWTIFFKIYIFTLSFSCTGQALDISKKRAVSNATMSSYFYEFTGQNNGGTASQTFVSIGQKSK